MAVQNDHHRTEIRSPLSTLILTRVFDAPRALVMKQFGAYEGARQALNRLARFLATV